MTNRLEPDAWLLPPIATTPEYTDDFWETHSYWSGPAWGRIHFVRNARTGECWWLNQNQWRYWNFETQVWVYANIRVRNRHSNLGASVVMAFLAVVIGSFLGSHADSGNDTPYIVGGFLFGLFIVLLGIANDKLSDHHPVAYNAVVVASWASGAASVIGLAGYVRGARHSHGAHGADVRQYSDDYTNSQIWGG